MFLIRTHLRNPPDPRSKKPNSNHPLTQVVLTVQLVSANGFIYHHSVGNPE